MPVIFQFVLLGLFALALFGIFRYLIGRMPGNKHYKHGMAVTMVTGFLLFWVNGAVGIIGSENNDANMMYLVLLAIVLFGSLISRFKPLPMARIMAMAAALMVVIAILALGFGFGVSGPVWPWDVVVVTAFFGAFWLTAGWLFREASRRLSDAKGISGAGA